MNLNASKGIISVLPIYYGSASGKFLELPQYFASCLKKEPSFFPRAPVASSPYQSLLIPLL